MDLTTGETRDEPDRLLGSCCFCFVGLATLSLSESKWRCVVMNVSSEIVMESLCLSNR